MSHCVSRGDILVVRPLLRGGCQMAMASLEEAEKWVQPAVLTLLLVYVLSRCALALPKSCSSPTEAARVWLELTQTHVRSGQLCTQGARVVGLASHEDGSWVAGRPVLWTHIRSGPRCGPLPVHVGAFCHLVASHCAGASHTFTELALGSVRLTAFWTQEPVRVQIFQEQCAVIADPELMKRVLSTNLGNYAKDLDFSYAPFMVRRISCCSSHAPR